MMALRAHRRGGPEQLVYEQAPKPAPAPGEVLVRVRAVAITFAELGWDPTWTRSDGTDRTPIIPGHEVCGVVEAANGGSVFEAGDEVYGLVDFDRDGAAAEYVCVPEAGLARKPGMATHEQAAAMALAALTAWQALIDRAAVQPGEKVLVTGLGASRYLDYTAGRLEREASGFDVVLDAAGVGDDETLYRVLRTGGRMILLAAPPDAERAGRHQVAATFFIVSPDAGELEELAGLVDKGQLKPVVSQSFPLAQGRAAFESAGRPRPPGKTVLIVP
jgi:NADPH:quinone reductase-like Zn-dependent oxidoreductase